VIVLRRTKRGYGFFFSLLINIFLNLEGAIPAVILLILHYIVDISIWWSVLAFALWIIYLIIWMLILGFVSRCSNTPDRKTVNKNPYSSTSYNPDKN